MLGLLDKQTHRTEVVNERVTIFHGRRGRVSFRCSINKSAVVWQNEVGTLSRVIKVSQELYKLPYIDLYYHV